MHKCIKEGWISFKDFVDKYFPELQSKNKLYKIENYKRIVQDFPDQYKDKVHNTWFVSEEHFCIRVKVEYRED